MGPLFENVCHSGFTLGHLGFTLMFNVGMLFGSTLRTEVCSRSVFYFTIFPPVVPSLVYSTCTCSVCFRGSISDQGLLAVSTGSAE